MKALFVISPKVSNHLLSEAVMNLEVYKNAFKNGLIIIGNGTTNGYLYKKITKENIDIRSFAAGIIENHKLSVVSIEQRLKPLIIEKGKVFKDENYLDYISKLGKNDIFIKGGNAIDNNYCVGILTGAEDGGTIGKIYGYILTQGVNLIIPISLRKLILNVVDNIKIMGKKNISSDYEMPVGLFPVNYGEVVTEIEAFKILFNLSANLVSSGGYKESEGDIVFLIEGLEKDIIYLNKKMEVWKE